MNSPDDTAAKVSCLSPFIQAQISLAMQIYFYIESEGSSNFAAYYVISCGDVSFISFVVDEGNDLTD